MTEVASRRMLWKCKLGKEEKEEEWKFFVTIAPRGGEGVSLGVFGRTGALWADRSQSMTNHLEDLMVLRSLDWALTSDIILSG